ncbi:MAG TPA: transcription-repair coupling factor [Fimbriiglobus sp.]
MAPPAGGPAAGVTLTELPRRIQTAEGWERLRASIRQGESGTIDGAWGSSRAAAVAALAEETPGSLLVVVPSVADLDLWADDLTSFSGTAPSLFPAFDTWPLPPNKGTILPEMAGRLRILQSFASGPPKVVVAPFAALIQPVPPLEDFRAQGRTLRTGEPTDPEELARWLVANGYKRADAVEFPGEFARRGGIFDIYPPDATDPDRLEFFGDELDSIRSFSAQTQRSLAKKESLRLVGLGEDASSRKSRGFLTDHFPPGSVVALVEPEELKDQGRHFFDRIGDPVGLFPVAGVFANLLKWPTVAVASLPRPTVEAAVHLKVESVERFSGNVLKVKDELDAVAGTDRVLIACQTDAEVHRLTEVLKTGNLSQAHRLTLVTGHVRAGFRLVGAGIVVLGSHELFHRDLLPPGLKAPPGTAAPGRKVESRAIDSFLDLAEGDYVVHVAHGIGRFRGMKMLEKVRSSEFGMGNEEEVGSAECGARSEDVNEAERAVHSALRTPHSALEEHLVLEFRGSVQLYVPASRIDLVQRYVGGQHAEPELSKLGGTSWGRKKDKVAEAVRDMAAEMIQLQAMRAALPGTPLPPDTDWQQEFEASFPYRETPDQMSAIIEIKGDLEKPKPMDRLLCGDVGYGKTEVALRAAFKAIDNGKQVALLVPTTILAEQHYRTFTQRLAEYPFSVEVVSRFKPPAKQKEILKRVAAGDVDITIGTHRIVSDDVKFKDLGLVIIDEEQRFGVEHKEKLKRLRATVHILTMTATPIPRTLHGALLGVREISNLETPPPDRFPVETRITRWDDTLLRHAIYRELNRGGQVYFVHNRVYDILDVAAKVSTLIPEAKIVVGHGQMDERELERAMVKFVRKEADILVATTIIESGLDIPNANTMFIDDADTYGLADLHQLRGRVGRTKTRAYAYLIVSAHKMVTPNAQKRLKAIEEFTQLGSGFKIAMRDLEIRGAGNILGTEQSGHIAAVGYEMYCTILENAVRQLKQLPPRVAVEVNVDLPWPAFLPRDYVPGQKLRIEVYRRLARLRDAKTLEDFRQELRDRYGPPPEPAEWLLRTTEIRLACMRWQIAGVHRDGKDLVFSYKNRALAEKLAKQSRGRLKVVDEKSAYLRLQPEEDEAGGMYELVKEVLGERSTLV